MKATPKPIATDVFQWTGRNYTEIPEWVPLDDTQIRWKIEADQPNRALRIVSFGKTIPVQPTYWLIRAINGGRGVGIKSDAAFRKSYDLKEEVK